MRPRALILVLSVLVMVAALYAASSAQTLRGPGLIRVNAVRASDRDGFPSIDTFWINSRSGKRIGWGVRMCHGLGSGGPLGPSTVQACEGTYVLPLGKIQTQGTRRGESSYLLAVIGGTGLYSNVGGSLLVERVDRKVDRLLFSLEAF